jgi:hypothetical protein
MINPISEFFSKNRNIILNLTIVGLSGGLLFFINKQLEKKLPEKYKEYANYIYFLDFLIALAGTYSIFSLNAGQLLENHAILLITSIQKKLEEDIKAGKSTEILQNRQIHIERHLKDLKEAIERERLLSGSKEKDLQNLRLRNLPESSLENQILQSFIKKMKDIAEKKEIRKIIPANGEKIEIMKYEEELLNNDTFGINPWWILGLLTILASIKSPDDKINNLIQEIIKMFSSPEGPNEM